MIIRSLEVANFRKFRDPLRIDGLTEGLNIVVEPNETGKSTLLEALRAAFFIRHSARTELVRSYVPIGDDVAPRVAVEFTVDGRSWSLEKQFVRSSFVRLTGDGSRRESDAAEEALQRLLGFERGNNRGTDPETRGPLGMLWVEQMSALAVEGPNRIVRDSVRGVLEAEVGAVTGGRRFDAIRAGVEDAYGALRTAASGKARGELAAAEAGLAAATTARQAAEASFREYGQALSDLDGARTRLRIVERELADPAVAEERRRLEADRRTAETASLRAVTAEAQHGRAVEVARAAASRVERLDGVEQRLGQAERDGVACRERMERARAGADVAAADEGRRRASLELAREAREMAESRLAEARRRSQAFALAAGSRRALDARRALADLEARETLLESEAALALDRRALDDVARLEREEVAALARFEAGAVRVEVELAPGAGLRIDGRSSADTSVDVLAVTRFEIGDAGAIVVRPPAGGGRAVEAELAAARDSLAIALRALGIASHGAGVERHERSGAATRELRALRAQIAAACPGDPMIGLPPGADALRAFVADLGGELPDAAAPHDDMDALEGLVSAARLAEVAASAGHDEGRGALARAESLLATASADFAATMRGADAAARDLRSVLDKGDRADLEAAHLEARRDLLLKSEALEQARDGMRAFDVDAIIRRLDNIARGSSRAAEERLELTGRIASLEATIVREGRAGPAGRLAEAEEDEVGASATCARLRREADVLEMLRDALTQAADEASRTFLAPVTRRASRYVERLLPGCGLSFDEGLGLTEVMRAGIGEACCDLSRGTQEQLAILTRLAFADLLLEDGAPISLILDDPFVYSDDARLEIMTNILEEASRRMQVILLTCRGKAFRHVDGKRITLP